MKSHDLNLPCRDEIPGKNLRCIASREKSLAGMETLLSPGVLTITANDSTHGHDYGETAPLRTPLLLASVFTDGRESLSPTNETDTTASRYRTPQRPASPFHRRIIRPNSSALRSSLLCQIASRKTPHPQSLPITVWPAAIHGTSLIRAPRSRPCCTVGGHTCPRLQDPHQLWKRGR